MPSGDHLKLAGDKKALKALASNSAGNDTVLWSLKVTKINKKGKPQQRVLLITNRHVLNLMPDNYSKCNRCINVHDLHHLSIASQEQEFALHVTGEYDYRLSRCGAGGDGAAEGVRGRARRAARDRVGRLGLRAADADDDEGVAQGRTTWSQKEGGSGALPTPTPSQKEAAAESATPAAAASSKSVAPDDDEDSEGEDDDEVSELRNDRASVAEAAALFHVGKKKYGADDFEMLKVLGKGAFGKVMLVKAKDSGTIYAMKSLSKAVLMERNEVVHTKTERKALEDTHHPFLVHLRFAFQTPTKLYLVMDYCNGGELFFHLKQAGRFEEPRARLYAAEIARRSSTSIVARSSTATSSPERAARLGGPRADHRLWAGEGRDGARRQDAHVLRHARLSRAGDHQGGPRPRRRLVESRHDLRDARRAAALLLGKL